MLGDAFKHVLYGCVLCAYAPPANEAIENVKRMSIHLLQSGCVLKCATQLFSEEFRVPNRNIQIIESFLICYVSFEF